MPYKQNKQKYSCDSAVLSLAAIAKTKVGAAKSLRAANVDFNAVLSAGFTAGELLEAGYTVKLLKEDGEFSCVDLRLGGASVYQLRSSGFTDEVILAAGFAQTEINQLTSC